jgi:succinate dehydrogenase / fumarate reductase cytochrome b subunit
MNLPDNLALRRLHSLTGAVFLGAFMLFHLYTNSYALNGPLEFNEQVKQLRAMPYLHIIEWAILLPLLYHSLYGVYIWYGSRNNFPQYNYARNLIYFMQRATGLIIFVFVYFHIYDQRLLPNPSYHTVKQSISNPALFMLYFFGVAAATYHVMIGLWSVSVKWGIAPGERAQRVLIIVFGILAAGFMAMGLRTLAGFMA